MKGVKIMKGKDVFVSDLSHRVIGCAIEVHRAHELRAWRIACKVQVQLPVRYKEVKLDCGYRIDLLVEGELIVELKCVERMQTIYSAQLLTYMKLAKIEHGLLINFNVGQLKDGLKSFLLSHPKSIHSIVPCQGL